MEIGTWRGSFCIHGGGGGQDSWYLFDEKRNAKLVAVLPWDEYGKGGSSVIIDDNIYWTGGCRSFRGRISWLFSDLIRHNISDDDPSYWEVVARSRIPRAMPFLAALDKNRILVLAGEELPNNNDVLGADWNKAGDIYHLDSKMWEYMNAEMTDFQLFRTIHASRFSGGIVFYCVFTGSMLFVTIHDDGGLTVTNNELGEGRHSSFALHRIQEKPVWMHMGLEHCHPKSRDLLGTAVRSVRGICCNDTLFDSTLSWFTDDLQLYQYSRSIRGWTWSFLQDQLPPISRRIGSHPILVDPMLGGKLDRARCLAVITEMDKFTIASISEDRVVSVREFPLADPSFRPYGAVYGPCYNFDLFVIGADSGVIQAAKLSAKCGARVAICDIAFHRINSDGSGNVDGRRVVPCCFPERIFFDGAAYGPEVEDARNYGWEVHERVNFNWRRFQQKKTEEIIRLNGIYGNLLRDAGVVLFEGRGKVIGPNEVEVIQQNGTKISYSARHILIATGSRAARPEIPGQELAITPDEAMSLEELPKHVVIIGEGCTAVEFASIWRGMGATVDLCFRNELPLSGFNDDMRAVVARNLKGRGIKLHHDNRLIKLEKSGDVIKVHLSRYANAILADVVLFATGHLPNTERLNLDAVGVELDKMKAVKVDEYSRTNVPSIWAIGDVTSRKNLTRVDLMEGTSFAKTVFDGKPTKLDYSHIPCAVFCTPPLSVVGISEEQVNGVVLVYTSKFNPVKNTITGRQEEAIMKLLVDKETRKILGASMCGPDAPEIMQRIAVALKFGATKEQLDSVGIHPSAAEEFFTMSSNVVQMMKPCPSAAEEFFTMSSNAVQMMKP